MPFGTTIVNIIVFRSLQICEYIAIVTYVHIGLYSYLQEWICTCIHTQQIFRYRARGKFCTWTHEKKGFTHIHSQRHFTCVCTQDAILLTLQVWYTFSQPETLYLYQYSSHCAHTLRMLLILTTRGTALALILMALYSYSQSKSQRQGNMTNIVGIAWTSRSSLKQDCSYIITENVNFDEQLSNMFHVSWLGLGYGVKGCHRKSDHT